MAVSRLSHLLPVDVMSPLRRTIRRVIRRVIPRASRRLVSVTYLLCRLLAAREFDKGNTSTSPEIISSVTPGLKTLFRLLPPANQCDSIHPPNPTTPPKNENNAGPNTPNMPPTPLSSCPAETPWLDSQVSSVPSLVLLLQVGSLLSPTHPPNDRPTFP